MLSPGSRQLRPGLDLQEDGDLRRTERPSSPSCPDCFSSRHRCRRFFSLSSCHCMPFLLEEKHVKSLRINCAGRNRRSSCAATPRPDGPNRTERSPQRSGEPSLSLDDHGRLGRSGPIRSSSSKSSPWMTPPGPSDPGQVAVGRIFLVFVDSKSSSSSRRPLGRASATTIVPSPLPTVAVRCVLILVDAYDANDDWPGSLPQHRKQRPGTTLLLRRRCRRLGWGRNQFGGQPPTEAGSRPTYKARRFRALHRGTIVVLVFSPPTGPFTTSGAFHTSDLHCGSRVHGRFLL
mmetsp:Transcript_39738/g.73250  ORF Transcript_39738/g.73250 Transcript_39738/m.73250 type:complete len:290 (-) Transcript_39738:49-918(-)